MRVAGRLRGATSVDGFMIAGSAEMASVLDEARFRGGIVELIEKDDGTDKAGRVLSPG